MASIIDSLIDSILSSNGKTNTDCKIYLSCAGEELLLPVPPAKFEITRAYNNSRITINKIGEINMLGKKGLKTLSITSIFPNQRYTFAFVSLILHMIMWIRLIPLQYPVKLQTSELQIQM